MRQLVPGQKDLAPTENGAMKRAEALATRLPGAAALCIVTDDETGELFTATVLGTFGEIPEGFAESLLDG